MINVLFAFVYSSVLHNQCSFRFCTLFSLLDHCSFRFCILNNIQKCSFVTICPSVLRIDVLYQFFRFIRTNLSHHQIGPIIRSFVCTYSFLSYSRSAYQFFVPSEASFVPYGMHLFFHLLIVTYVPIFRSYLLFFHTICTNSCICFIHINIMIHVFILSTRD